MISIGWFWRGRREGWGAREEKEEGLFIYVDCVFKRCLLIGFSISVQEYAVQGLARRSEGGGGLKGCAFLTNPKHV